MARLPPDPRYIFRGDMGCVYCVLFQVNSATEHLYAGTDKGNVHIWDLKVNKTFGYTFFYFKEINLCLICGLFRTFLSLHEISVTYEIKLHMEMLWLNLQNSEGNIKFRKRNIIVLYV